MKDKICKWIRKRGQRSKVGANDVSMFRKLDTTDSRNSEIARMHAWKCSRNKWKPIETVQISFIELRDLKHQFEARKVEKKRKKEKWLSRGISTNWFSVIGFQCWIHSRYALIDQRLSYESPLLRFFSFVKWFRWQLTSFSNCDKRLELHSVKIISR